VNISLALNTNFSSGFYFGLAMGPRVPLGQVTNATNSINACHTACTKNWRKTILFAKGVNHVPAKWQQYTWKIDWILQNWILSCPFHLNRKQQTPDITNQKHLVWNRKLITFLIKDEVENLAKLNIHDSRIITECLTSDCNVKDHSQHCTQQNFTLIAWNSNKISKKYQISQQD
jgi:hypothetical protein